MKFRILLIILSAFIFNSCDQQIVNNSKKFNKNFEKKYNNSGFALIYNDKLKIKKLDDRSLNIFHNSLKRKSFVMITNPTNKKSLIAEVKSNNVKFSNFYNSIISSRIAEELELDFNEPFIEIKLISKNSTYIAKKSKTFKEEQKVAEKAPVDGITIDNLGVVEKKETKVKKQKFLYSIKIADFYYKDSADNMINRITEETNLKNYMIKKLSKTKYRVLLGPFNDIKNLEESFNEIKSLNFENLEILKDV